MSAFAASPKMPGMAFLLEGAMGHWALIFTNYPIIKALLDHM